MVIERIAAVKVDLGIFMLVLLACVGYYFTFNT